SLSPFLFAHQAPTHAKFNLLQLHIQTHHFYSTIIANMNANSGSRARTTTSANRPSSSPSPEPAPSSSSAGFSPRAAARTVRARQRKSKPKRPRRANSNASDTEEMVREDGSAENKIPAPRAMQPALPADSDGEADWEGTSEDDEVDDESSLEEEEDDEEEGVSLARGEKRKAGSEDEREGAKKMKER
ncbi:hypothetical protein BDU57DRAFT_582162, partial [Ampelomyces quisqualis]